MCQNRICGSTGASVSNPTCRAERRSSRCTDRFLAGLGRLADGASSPRPRSAARQDRPSGQSPSIIEDVGEHLRVQVLGPFFDEPTLQPKDLTIAIVVRFSVLSHRRAA